MSGQGVTPDALGSQGVYGVVKEIKLISLPDFSIQCSLLGYYSTHRLPEHSVPGNTQAPRDYKTKDTFISLKYLEVCLADKMIEKIITEYGTVFIK